MRPVRRGPSPRQDDFEDYADAKPELISRLGEYCSYCERRIVTLLAVEHIQPKSLHADLNGRWENFLLACTNCNSIKGNKAVCLDQILLPDRDNTFVALRYLPDGRIAVSAAAEIAGKAQQAQDTLTLTGLDRHASQVLDQNGRRVAMDRVSQRMQTWVIAEDARDDLQTDPKNVALRRAITHMALSQGFFSIWVTVFQDDIDMCRRFVVAFPGTDASGCFDAIDASPCTPAPNPDGLAGGAKI